MFMVHGTHFSPSSVLKCVLWKLKTFYSKRKLHSTRITVVQNKCLSFCKLKRFGTKLIYSKCTFKYYNDIDIIKRPIYERANKFSTL